MATRITPDGHEKDADASFADPRPALRARAEAAGVDAKLLNRFLAKTEFDANTGCLNWTGAHNADGYGSVRWINGTRSTHRIAYELGHGSIARGLHVLHACNNRRCVNPDHLRTGTPADNKADAVAAGTAGRQPGRSYSDKQIAEIPGLLMLDWNATEIRKATWISRSAIQAVKAGRAREGAISNELDRDLANREAAEASGIGSNDPI